MTPTLICLIHTHNHASCVVRHVVPVDHICVLCSKWTLQALLNPANAISAHTLPLASALLTHDMIDCMPTSIECSARSCISNLRLPVWPASCIHLCNYLCSSDSLNKNLSPPPYSSYSTWYEFFGEEEGSSWASSKRERGEGGQGRDCTRNLFFLFKWAITGGVLMETYTSSY